MDIQTTVPQADFPLVRDGKVTEAWFRFFLMLFNRTGANSGSDINIVRRNIDDLMAAINAEEYGSAIAALQDAMNVQPSDVSVFNNVEDYLPNEAYVHGSLEGGDLHSTATTSTAGFMSSSDKTKLDTLSALIFTPQAITADVSAINTAADVNVFNVTIPANSLQVGSSFNAAMTIIVSSIAVAGQTFSMWVKVGATKVIFGTYSFPAAGLTNQPIANEFMINTRTIGASGTIQLTGYYNAGLNVQATGFGANTALGNIDTTVSNTLTVGINWGAANAGNQAVVKTGLMKQEK